MNVTDENQRQCNPKGNVSFPLRFDSGITSNVPINDPKFMMTFTKRASNKLNPKFEDESRTTGGLLDESFNSLKIVYNNFNYSLIKKI
jgi:hypothetical protein